MNTTKNIYTNLRNLPAFLQGYKNTDVSLCVTNGSAELNTCSNDGERSVVLIHNLKTGVTITKTGDWGGASINSFSMADSGRIEQEISPGIVCAIVVHGGINNEKGRVSRCWMHPSDFVVEEEKTLLNERQELMLYAINHVSSYRAGISRSLGLGSPDLDNTLVKELIAAGMLKKAGKGVGLTSEGRTLLNTNCVRIQSAAYKLRY